jgi:hypothetical protein
MTANNKFSLNVLRKMEKSVERLKNLVANQVGALNRDAEDRSHIATLGDRPFVGCRPCKPEEPEEPL